MQKILSLLLLGLLSISFSINVSAQSINGAWGYKDSTQEIRLVLIDNYFALTSFSTSSFHWIACGKARLKGDSLYLEGELDTRQISPMRESLIIVKENLKWGQLIFSRFDEGEKALSGVWRISHRKKGEELIAVEHKGGRKTLKILSEKYFQWIAFDSSNNHFFGTGGGSYSFEEGIYTENIEFFSRDQSRVGASLTFNGKLENQQWIHSGKSSKGDSIFEVWQKWIE